LAAYAFFRNRVDELVAQTSLIAEHVFSTFKRAPGLHRPEARRKRPLSSNHAASTRETPAESPSPTAEN
jgi:hypothetical protein